MNDRIFDILYKAEQRENAEKLCHKEMINRNLLAGEAEYPSIKLGIQRIWQLLTSRSKRE